MVVAAAAEGDPIVPAANEPPASGPDRLIRRIHRTGLLSLFAILALLPHTGQAARPLVVAVAANFAPAMEEIGALFTRESAIPVQTTVSSSGRLYAQISNRAPFDIFFSADSRRPQLLFQQGLCERPEVYVRGRVVLWSRDRDLCAGAGNWQDLLKTGAGRTGIPNPELAPYGEAARQALIRAGLWDRLQERLVFAANVARSFQYAATGATRLSFISASLATTAAGTGGCFLPLDEAKPVAQAVCVVSASKNREAARALVRFLHRNPAASTLERYGYERP